MQNKLVLQLPIVPINQLFSTREIPKDLLSTLYLAQYYLANSDQINTIPIPIKRDNSADQPRYEVLANHHTFFALKKAQRPLARCLSLNRPEEHPEVWQAELQVQRGKFNVTAMNEEDLQQAFACLAEKERGLTLLSRGGLIQALVNSPSRPYWSSWDPLKALAKSLKVSITKKHTDCLDNYFLFDPQPLPSLCINTASPEEIDQRLQMLSLAQKAVDTLSVQLSNSPSRPYWSSWDPLKALAKPLKITKKHTDCLDNYFLFDPQPLPSLCINTASPEEIKQRLQVLFLEQKAVDNFSAQLSSSPNRLYWRNSKDMAQAIKLEAQATIPKASQTAITKGFTFTPAPPPIPNTLPFLLQAMTVPALRQEASQRGLAHKGLKKKAELVQLLSGGSPT